MLPTTLLSNESRFYEHKIGGLHSFNNYRFEIEACKGAGCGQQILLFP